MTILSCSVVGCEAVVFIKKHQLCQPHYHRFISKRDLCIEAAAVDCKRCGERIGRRQSRNGPPPTYCTAECRQLAAYERSIESGAQAASYAKRREAFQPKPVTQRQCECCGGVFLAKRGDARFCSKSCVQRFGRSNPDGTCTAGDCERTGEAKGICSMHWKRERRAAGLIENEPWDERRKANYQQRRALKLNLPADNIRPADIYERDEWVCGICSTPVDRTRAYPDPMSPSLDHVLPLSRGGHHTLENVTLAHLSCNVRKGNRVEADAMSV